MKNLLSHLVITNIFYIEKNLKKVLMQFMDISNYLFILWFDQSKKKSCVPACKQGEIKKMNRWSFFLRDFMKLAKLYMSLGFWSPFSIFSISKKYVHSSLRMFENRWPVFSPPVFSPPVFSLPVFSPPVFFPAIFPR